MRRYLEIIRRKMHNFTLKCTVVLACVAIMFLVFFALDKTMRFTEIFVNGQSVAHIYAPVYAQQHTLNLANIKTIPQDDVHLTQNENGFATFDIERAFEVEITADGTTQNFLTTQKSVQTLLSENGYELGEHDYTEPSLYTVVSDETAAIDIFRVEYVQYEVDEVIPYETEMQYTSLFYLFRDTVLEIQQGQDGYFKGVMEDKVINGQVVDTRQVSTEVDTEPVTEILKVYKELEPISPLEPPDGITVEDFVPSSYTTVYEMKATGYYSARGKGASGLGLYYGTFAVDPTVIPYGTKVYIVSTNGKFVYGWAIATDTGAFINTNRMQVDLFYETYAESAANGVQQVYVYVP